LAEHTQPPLQPWLPGDEDEVAFGTGRPRAKPPVEAANRASRSAWWDRLRNVASDVLASGSLSNRLVTASAAVEAPVVTGRRIVVVGAVDRAGTSMVAALLAVLLSSKRREATLALDFSPGSQGLQRYTGARNAPALPSEAATLNGHPARTLAGLLAPGAAVGNHLFVLGLPTSPGAGGSFDSGSWPALSSLFSRFAAATVVDAGSPPNSSLTQALLGTAHAAVVVAPDDEIGEEHAIATRELLSRQFPELPLLTVWTGTSGLGEAGGELGLPHDGHLAEGGKIRPGRLGARTRIAAMEIAGAVLTAANGK
jgi:hypothetical protein